MPKTCSLKNNESSICDNLTNSTVLVTNRVKIPETNFNMNLVGKALCRYHYNKLIVNENKWLARAAKKQQCAHPKHELYVNNNKRDVHENMFL